jgi:hypothetical protein
MKTIYWIFEDREEIFKVNWLNYLRLKKIFKIQKTFNGIIHNEKKKPLTAKEKGRLERKRFKTKQNKTKPIKKQPASQTKLT